MGGLERLAKLPSSTIQVLGAEKALFRAIKTGSRPPKHGILFQHDDVHSAPKWQRGKVARSLANKIAIAARIDNFRGTKDDGLTGPLAKRLEEIRTKYKDPPKVRGKAVSIDFEDEANKIRGPARRRIDVRKGKVQQGKRKGGKRGTSSARRRG